MGNRPMNGVLAYQRLARSRGRTHHNGMPLIQGINRFQLEPIQREWKQLGNIR